MNVLHLKYAVEVAENGSINKAAEALYMNQPNLSKAIKELENSLGITIFSRTAKGMNVTPEGEEFLRHARKILRQIDEMEALYKGGAAAQQRFSISVPRASYISHAFAQFSKGLSNAKTEIYYKETNAMRAIQNIISGDYKLGIVRYAECFDKYFKSLLEEKGMAFELVAEFQHVLVMSRAHPLADREPLSQTELRPYIEIAHPDPYVPSLPLTAVRKEELPGDIDRRVYVFERASQFELLSENTETFMWVSPIPADTLARYGLVQKACQDNRRIYRDVLIHKKDYRLTALDQAFVTELCKAKRAILDGITI